MNELPTPEEIASMDDRTLIAAYFATSQENDDPEVELPIADMAKRELDF